VRIVFLNQFYAPAEAATAQLLSDLAGALASAGHDVSVVCSGRSYPEPRPIKPRRERLDGVSVYRAWTTGFGRNNRSGRLLDYATFMIGAAWRLLLHEKPDVIVSLTSPPMVDLVGAVLARVRDARSVIWVMDVYPELAFELGVLRAGSLSGRFLDRLSRYSLRRSDAIVALGETMARRLEEASGKPVEVVHNWADGNAIRPAALDSHALRTEWNWGDRFVVLYSGNLGLAHEFDTVLGAADLLRSDPRVLFAFVGSGPRRREVEEAVARLELPNVEFRPHVVRARLGQCLTAGNLHLITLRERMPGLLVPSKIYGILAAGRPTIYVGPEDGEIAEILRRGGCGSRVGNGDARGLADLVLDYAADEARSTHEGKRARESFEERFDTQRTLGALRAVIESAGAEIP